ncbi:MAG: DUF11 domain-containing protein [Methanosarcinales archaeon]|nr:DUF11 domain-containing protein [Methanosarcinales archaeon]
MHEIKSYCVTEGIAKLKKNRIIWYSLFLFFILVLPTGSASATNIYGERIYEGDGYQINNYFIEVTDITSFSGDLLLEINIYQLNPDGSYDDLTVSTTIVDDKRRVKYQSGSIEILVNEKNLSSQYAIVDITTTGITVEYEKAVDGGVSNAIYVGEPSITLTKEVDKSSVDIGDTIRVTIKARNTGSGTAQRVSIDPGITPGFTFKSNIYSTYPSELAVGTTYIQMYIYEVEAAKSGTFTLSPAVATYSSSVFGDDYTSPSTRPTVTVAEEEVETSELEITISQDKTKLKRDEKITFTIYVKNLKDVPASTIKITPVIPQNLTYLSGSEDIDIINEKPIIQKSIFGARYEDEYKFTLRADEVGANNLTVKLTYNNGVQDIPEEVTSDMFYVEKGKYDSLAEYPIYVYITPVIVIIAIAGWLHWRRSQFRM